MDNLSRWFLSKLEDIFEFAVDNIDSNLERLLIANNRRWLVGVESLFGIVELVAFKVMFISGKDHARSGDKLAALRVFNYLAQTIFAYVSVVGGEIPLPFLAVRRLPGGFAGVLPIAVRRASG